jgi:hypothetical protein
MADVTGWANLTSGHVVNAVFTAYNTPMGGYLIFLLYITISLILWVRTQSIELCTMMSFLFLGTFLITPWFNNTTLGLAILITAFELGATIFKFFASYKPQ